MQAISASWELPIDLDVLNQAVRLYLEGLGLTRSVYFTRDGDVFDGVVYRLHQQDLGDLGEIRLRKLRDGMSEMLVSGPPLVNKEPAKPTFEKTPTRDELQAALRQRREERERLRQRRNEHQRAVIEGLLTRLAQERIWPEKKPGAKEKRDGTESVRVPERGVERRKWVRTWALVRRQVEEARPYEEICTWLEKMHPNLACSPETLADIIKAGEQGLLTGTMTQELYQNLPNFTEISS